MRFSRATTASHDTPQARRAVDPHRWGRAAYCHRYRAGFKDAGAEVTTTNTLKQALTLVEHDGLTAAILDHALRDGDSACLRKLLRERDIPFVVYSGFGEAALRTDVPLVKKPASADVLVATAWQSLQ
jgi:DNA-binding response OmpR family regulator